MIISDFHVIGNKLLQFRKKVHLTQIEVAELAGLSDRTYADIERGNVNMRLDTLLRICSVLHITPNDILTEEPPAFQEYKDEILSQLNDSPPKVQERKFRYEMHIAGRYGCMFESERRVCTKVFTGNTH